MEYLLALSRSVLWRCLVHGWENATWVSKHQTCLWNMPLQYIRKIGMVQERILYLYSRTCVSRPPHWPYKIWCLNISVGGLWRQVPVLRDLCHNNTCLEGPLVFGRRSHISMWMNLKDHLSWETIFFMANHQRGCLSLSRQALLYYIEM